MEMDCGSLRPDGADAFTALGERFLVVVDNDTGMLRSVPVENKHSASETTARQLARGWSKQ